MSPDNTTERPASLDAISERRLEWSVVDLEGGDLHARPVVDDPLTDVLNTEHDAIPRHSLVGEPNPNVFFVGLLEFATSFWWFLAAPTPGAARCGRAQ